MSVPYTGLSSVREIFVFFRSPKDWNENIMYKIYVCIGFAGRFSEQKFNTQFKYL